jgi:hypothetical protein
VSTEQTQQTGLTNRIRSKLSHLNLEQLVSVEKLIQELWYAQLASKEGENRSTYDGTATPSCSIHA